MAYDGSLVFDTSLNTQGFAQSLENLSTAASSLLGFDELFTKLSTLSSIASSATQSFAALQNQSFLTQNALASAFSGETLVAAVQNSLSGVLNTLAGFSNSQQIFFAGQNIVGTLANGVSGNAALIFATANAVANAKNAASASVGSNSFGSVGINMVSGIASGIYAGASGVVSAITSVVSSAISAAKSVLAIHSPSKVFDLQVGRMMMSGLEDGINYGAKSASFAMKKSMEDISSSALSMAKSQFSNSNNDILAAMFSNSGLFSSNSLKTAGNFPSLQNSAEAIVALMRTGIEGSGLNYKHSPPVLQGANAYSQAQNAGATTNLYMTVNTHDSLSESELTRQAEDFLTRARRKLP